MCLKRTVVQGRSVLRDALITLPWVGFHLSLVDLIKSKSNQIEFDFIVPQKIDNYVVHAYNIASERISSREKDSFGA